MGLGMPSTHTSLYLTSGWGMKRSLRRIWNFNSIICSTWEQSARKSRTIRRETNKFWNSHKRSPLRSWVILTPTGRDIIRIKILTKRLMGVCIVKAQPTWAQTLKMALKPFSPSTWRMRNKTHNTQALKEKKASSLPMKSWMSLLAC